MLRGVAALTVIAEHARSFIFYPHSELESLHWAWTFFYATTTLGHQAVIIFFAMSGFLVGGKIFESFQSGTWSWSRYALRRLTRLWIVVIPTLALTFLLDRLGFVFGYAPGYEGLASELYASLPVYGSNGPLWSLAYEFWYYVMAPLVVSLVFLIQHPLKFIINTIFLASIIWFLPTTILLGGLIWGAGAVARILMPRWALAIQSYCRSLALLSILTIVSLMVIAEMHPVPAADLILGVAVAASLPILALAPSGGQAYSLLAKGLAEISFTLYATHFPILMAACMIFIASTRSIPGFHAAMLFVSLLFGTLICAVLIWACFERHTGRVYSSVVTWFSSIAKTSP